MAISTYDAVIVPGTPGRTAGVPEHVATALDDVEHHAFRIDTEHADTDAFTEVHRWPLDHAVNCIVVVGKRSDRVVHAMCAVLASTRIDVNKAVRRALDVRKVSFAATDTAAAATDMEVGSITPFGAPAGWPILVDARVTAAGLVAVGGGRRNLKVAVDGQALGQLPHAEVIEGLAVSR